MTDGEKREIPAVPTSPEQPQAPEVPKAVESRAETAAPAMGADVRAEAAPAPAKETAPAAKAAAVPAMPEQKDKYRVRVERVLEQNLWDLYFALPQGAREKFKAQGEAAAAALRTAIESKRVKPSQVLKPVLKWLKTIPKVNPYFLEQEAKIKTDQIMALVEERKKEEGLE